MKKLQPIKFFTDLTLRTQLILTYVLLIVFIVLIIGFIYYRESVSIITENSRKSMHEIVKKNNAVLDTKLSSINERALRLVTDKDLYYVFNDELPQTIFDVTAIDNKVSGIIYKYFSYYDDIFSAYIITKENTFSNYASMFIPEDTFHNTTIYNKAVEAKGKLQWIPTYNFAKMYDQKALEAIDLEYKYMFSAVKLLNITLINNYDVYDKRQMPTTVDMEPHLEKPILLINFKESIISNLYNNSLPIEDARYLVVSPDNTIVSHSNQQKLGTVIEEDWLEAIKKNQTGTAVLTIDGEKSLLCYDTGAITGWLSIVIVPYNQLVSSMPSIQRFTLVIVFILCIIGILIALGISDFIVRPIKKLLKAMKHMEKGDFSTRIQIDSGGELGILVNNFNGLNEKITHLIEENYMVKIREKEAQIMALNLQLNPHFLSNTLNTINWMAIENNEKEISHMIISLSTMLQYTMYNTKELVTLEEDLKWLKSYIHIMSNRYLNLFAVKYQMNPLLLQTPIPKLFLQPFVENTIIHGFEDMESGGHIIISGKIINDKRVFMVEDNGKGITAEEIDKAMKADGLSIGIKNIDKRIKLIYGEAYGVTIKPSNGDYTKITITMPMI